jgi:hypothetical protein
LVVVSLLLAQRAWAKTAEPADPYEAARDAEASLNYKSVLSHATKALEVAQTHERLVNLYQMLGISNAVLGHTDAAIDAFKILLAIDPDHHMPRGTSPKINGPFKEAGGYWIDRPGGLQITPTLPREILAAKPLAVPVKLDDPLQLTTTVRVNYRLVGDAEFQVLEATASPLVTLNIPAEQIVERKGDYSLELFFTALSAKGSELRLAGSAGQPLTVVVHGKQPELISPVLFPPNGGYIEQKPVKKPPPAFLKKWWFWAAIGGGVVVVVALGTGLGLYFTRDTSHVDLGLSSRTGP